MISRSTVRLISIFLKRVKHHNFKSQTPGLCGHHICQRSNVTENSKPLHTSTNIHTPREVNPRLKKQYDLLANEYQNDGIDIDRGRDTIPRRGVAQKVLHKPVMVNEVLEFFQPSENQVFLDMTFGGGGHTQALLNSNPTTKVFALDRDPTAFHIAENLSKKYGARLSPLLGKFTDIPKVLSEAGVPCSSLDGVLIDAGCSSMQMDDTNRGFALSTDGPLDMRMDMNRNPSTPTAADVISTLDDSTLSRIIKTYGEERNHKKIAKLIVEYREKYKKIETTEELATVVSYAFSHSSTRQSKDKLGRKSHVATRTFQALRIFVNDELNELQQGIELVAPFVKSGGKFAALTFHSLEDRIVKRMLMGRDVNDKGLTIHEWKRTAPKGVDIRQRTSKTWEVFNKQILTPSENELLDNPRSRSAKLRLAVKL